MPNEIEEPNYSNLKGGFENFLSAPDDEQNFKNKCICLLKRQDIKSCFKVLPIGDIRKEFLKKAKKDGKHVRLTSLINLENVIKNLEMYARNLLLKPWCKDFHAIKTYNGFFKYNIELWIPLAAACKVLQLIGYYQESDGDFTINEPFGERILTVGFELYLAHIQLSEFRNCGILDNYSLDDIFEAHNNTTGCPIKIIEWLQENRLLTNQGTKSSVTSKSGFEQGHDSDQVTTCMKYEHYDKHGKISQERVKYPPKCHIEAEVFDSYNSVDVDFIKNSFASLSNTDIPDAELYGDDTDDITQDGLATMEENLQVHMPPHKHHLPNHNAQVGYASLPPRFSLDPYSNHQPRDDLQLGRCADRSSIHSKHVKEQVKNKSFKQTTIPLLENRLPQHSDAVPRGAYHTRELPQFSHAEHQYAYGDGLRKSEYVTLSQKHDQTGGPGCVTMSPSAQITSVESLSQDKEKYVKLLDDRIKAGEKDLNQLSPAPDHFLPSISVSDINKKSLCYRCFRCSRTPIICCLKCGIGTCETCLKVLTRGPCISGKDHKYEVLESYDALDKESSSTVTLQDQLDSHQPVSEDQLPCGNMWKCQRCTFRNSSETSVCETCDRSRYGKISPPVSGSWVCSNCTFANPENVKQCEVCGKEKDNFHTYV